MKSFSGAALWIYLLAIPAHSGRFDPNSVQDFQILYWVWAFYIKAHSDLALVTKRHEYICDLWNTYFQIRLHLHNFNTQECFQKKLRSIDIKNNRKMHWKHVPLIKIYIFSKTLFFLIFAISWCYNFLSNTWCLYWHCVDTVRHLYKKNRNL